MFHFVICIRRSKLRTMQLASWSFPNFGLTKGAICRQRKLCTDTGNPRSNIPSSSPSILNSSPFWLLAIAVWPKALARTGLAPITRPDDDCNQQMKYRSINCQWHLFYALNLVLFVSLSLSLSRCRGYQGHSRSFKVI